MAFQSYDSIMRKPGQPSEKELQRAEEWGKWARSNNPYAIASLVVGLFSLLELGVNLVFGIAGIVLGVVALRILKTDAGNLEKPQNGHRLAQAGITLSVLSLLLAAFLLLRRKPF